MGRRTDQPGDSAQRGLDEVVDRLSLKVPGVDVDRTREIVAEELGSYDRRPVRDFVPVLVE